MTKTLLFSQDECSPDSLQTFIKFFYERSNEAFYDFINTSNKVSEEDSFYVTYTKNNLILEISADNPFYKLYELK